MIDYEWDEYKRITNLKKHEIEFSFAENFIWESAVLIEDDRQDYKETRYRAMGLIGIRVYALVFTMRGKSVRIISLRKATHRETKDYDKNTRY